MADAIFDELRGLFGQAIDSEEVAAFLARYPDHTIDRPSDGRQYVTAPRHGFELLFGLPDGSYSGGKTAHLRVLICIFLNSAAVPKAKPFADLPLGLSFDEGHEQHVTKFGPPIMAKAWGTGDIYTAQWQIEDVVLHAEYVRGKDKTKCYTLQPIAET
jgi:hypothetical protein